MNVVIETYELSSEPTVAADGTFCPGEDPAEIARLRSELGLKEKPKEQVSDIGWQEMTREEEATYETLFPNHEKLVDYTAGPIPLRVLQLAALCEKEQQFSEGLWIWHASAAIMDPLLVGARKGAGVSRYCLLARWGTALRPFAEMLKEAKERRLVKARKAIVAMKSELDALLAGGLDAAVEKTFAERYVTVGGYYYV